MEEKIHLFYYQVNGKLLNTSLGGNQSFLIKYHKLLCPMEFSVENEKSIPTAYDSTGHLNIIYIKLLIGQINQCKEINKLFSITSQL